MGETGTKFQNWWNCMAQKHQLSQMVSSNVLSLDTICLYIHD